MGARGPTPKRSSQRRRRNKESKPERVVAPARSAPADPIALAAAHTKSQLLGLAAAAGAEVSATARKAEIAKAIVRADPAAPDPEWHPIAKRWFHSLRESAQSKFYEPSDWAMARIVAESISRDLKPQVVGVQEDGEVIYATIPMKGAALAAYLKAMTALMVSEGDRRRLKIEIDRSSPEDAENDDVPNLDDYRDRAASG